ncbi:MULTISPECIES: hypothetical protein [Micromonospora]|uniref:hypothetical protein n=1 Tax=Micromonospora TaxID=1873 RepID=UPI000206B053|nr:MULTISPECIES: hypothetical protein [Micromonospora]AEB46777.1 hypothetical protein VAB18032_28531 [Micromonospora maris AB-18-032]
MPEPQPGTDRPVDGNRPDAHRDGEPAVTQEQPTPVVLGAPTGPDGTRVLPADAPDPTSAPRDADQPTREDSAVGSDATAAPPADADATAPTATAPGQPDDVPRSPRQAAGGSGDAHPTKIDPGDAQRTTIDPGEAQRTAIDPGDAQRTAIDPGDAQSAGTPPTAVGPQGTRVMSQPVPDEEPAPRWSGSAAVPPAAPRRPSWGESAEPTPPPVAAAHQPEHQTPVDPWAGVDTSGWELHSADFPALPPTLSYPAPPPTTPYSGPPAHQPPAQQPPAANFPPPAVPAPPMPPASPAYPQAGYPPPPVHQAPAPSPRPAARPPAPVGPPPPPARGRKVKKLPPAAPPPGWQPPPGNVRARKRRRWPWVLLLTLACCCGCPAYYGMPMATQYPADAALPRQVADLRLREDPRNAQTARKLEAQTRQAHLLSDNIFAGVYTTSVGKRVTVFGGTGFRLTPSSDADAEIERLTQEYSLGAAEVVDSGVRGRHGRCAVGSSDGIGVVVCTSVDHGSLTTAVFTGLSVDDSARLLDTLREEIITPA